MLDFWPRALHGVGRRTTRKPHLRLAVALPFVTALLALGVGLYSFEVGRTDATHLMSPHDAARVWAAPPASCPPAIVAARSAAPTPRRLALARRRALRAGDRVLRHAAVASSTPSQYDAGVRLDRD